MLLSSTWDTQLYICAVHQVTTTVAMCSRFIYFIDIWGEEYRGGKHTRGNEKDKESSCEPDRKTVTTVQVSCYASTQRRIHKLHWGVRFIWVIKGVMIWLLCSGEIEDSIGLFRVTTICHGNCFSCIYCSALPHPLKRVCRLHIQKHRPGTGLARLDFKTD